MILMRKQCLTLPNHSRILRRKKKRTTKPTWNSQALHQNLLYQNLLSKIFFKISNWRLKNLRKKLTRMENHCLLMLPQVNQVNKTWQPLMMVQQFQQAFKICSLEQHQTVQTTVPPLTWQMWQWMGLLTPWTSLGKKAPQTWKLTRNKL